MTELTPIGESAGCPHLFSAALAKPGEDDQSSRPTDCAHYGPEHLSGHEATGQYAVPCNSQTPPTRIINPPTISST